MKEVIKYFTSWFKHLSQDKYKINLMFICNEIKYEDFPMIEDDVYIREFLKYAFKITTDFSRDILCICF